MGGADDDLGSMALLYSRRVAGLATELRRCHELGVLAGDHDGPWESSFQRRAVPIYLETLPIEYLRDLAVNFKEAAAGLVTARPRSGTASASDESWTIVETYLRNSSAAILEHPVPADRAPAPPRPLEIEATTPSVMRFDLLAGLVSEVGVERLASAADAVISEIERSQRPRLDLEAIELLQGLVAGMSVVDLATQIGRSERQTYRLLGEVWETLGVENRRAGLVRAAELGYFDDTP